MVGLSQCVAIHALQILAGQPMVTLEVKHLAQIEPGLIADIGRKSAARTVSTEQFRE